MRKTLISSVTSLLLPFTAYSTQASYGYQRKNHAGLSNSLLHESSHHRLRIRAPERVAADALVIEKGLAVHELVVMDGGISESDKAALRRALNPGVALVEIDSNAGGLSQLLSALEGYKNLAAIHVVSHAEAGAILLGNSRITPEAIREEVHAFAALKGAVREGGDLLFYGCDLAANEAGEALLDIISNNTGLDVAASNNLTGNAELQGDWDLEVTRGNIESTLAFSEKALTDFSGVLAPFTGTITFGQTKNAGDYYGNATVNAEVWATGTSGYFLIIDGSTRATELYSGLGSSGQAAFTLNTENSVTLRFDNNEPFSPQSLKVANIAGGNGTTHSFTFTSNKGSFSQNVVTGTPATIDLTSFGANVTYVTITSNVVVYAWMDDFSVVGVGVTVPEDPTITSAVYDASTGVLVVTGTNFAATGGATNDVVANKFTFTAEGGSTYTLTDTANVEITSATSFTLTLSATDRAAANLILNKNGTSSTGNTIYNLAGAAGFIAASGATADTTNGITVSNVAAPTITSASYAANAGTLVVTATGLTNRDGAANDIDVSMLTVTGEGGETYTLTDSADVEISSGTMFVVLLSPTDSAAVDLIFNKNGTSSTGATTYNLAAAEDWAVGADASAVVADLAGNGITVVNVAIPTITSATYNGTSGVLAVTGTGFAKLNGATNDIDISKLTIAGDATPYALTTGSVEITNGTSFSVTLNGTDQAALLSRINQDGTASLGTVTYNLAAAEDWAVGADAAVVVADLTANGITASDINVGGVSSGCAAIQAYWSNGITLSNGDEDWQDSYVVAAGEVITYQVTSSGSTNASNNQASGAGFTIYSNGGDATDVPEPYAYLNNELNLNGSHTVAADDGNYVVYLWSGASDATATATVTCGDAPPVDNVAPSFQNSTPSISNINTSWVTLTARLDEVGTAYYVVVADGAGAPSSAQVVAGQNSTSAAALVSGSLNVASAGADYSALITGLSAGTVYDIYVVAQDDEGTPNVQASPTLVNITTSTANALYFDDNAKITGLTGISPVEFTVEFSLFLDSVTPPGNWQGIYWTDNNNDTGIFVEDNYAVSLWDTSNTAYKSDLKLTYGAWNHVAVSYSAANGVRIYINGVLSSLNETGTPGAGVLPLTDVTMGYGPGNYGASAGGYALGDSALEDFRIWDIERTAQDINDDKDAELIPPYSANLVRYYDFNHGIGGANNAGVTTLIERTGNGADGTLADFTLSGDVSNWVETSSLSSADTDATLSAAGGVSEPIGLATTVDTVGEAVEVFDFTISDGGTADLLATTVSQIVVNVSGTSTDAERGQITWRLNGPDASNVTGTYDAGADTITFSGLSISIADGDDEIYTINAYFNDNTNLTEDRTIILSIDGDTDLTVGGGGTQMGSTSAVANGSGTTIDVVATQLAITTQPAGSVSGAALTTQPVIAARDAFGNTDTDFTETITLTEASAGSLTNNTQAATAGVATFTTLTYSATTDQQAFTLTANDQDGVGSNLATVDATSVTSDVVATQLVFSTQPAPTSVNSGVATSFTTVPVVSATNAGGVVDTGYATDITLAEVNGAGSATMSGTGDTDGNGSTVSITPSSGVATFTGLQITYTNVGVSETFNLRALSGGLTAADSTQFTSASTPLVSDGNISINGATGTGGAFKIGDTVTASWNNTGGGDNNAGITGVTVDFTEFGGGAAVVASESSATWTATYTIIAGAIDANNRNVSVTATNTAGDTTTADTTNATVDNVAPVVTDGNISISGASGTGGAFKIGDTVTAIWNNTAGGNNNSDIASATVDFSQFGGGAAVSASDSGGTWTATYTITAGLVDADTRNVALTVTDNAGNTTTTADGSNATLDSIAPVVSASAINISGGTGVAGTYIIGDTVTATWDNSATGDNNSDTMSAVTVDFTQFGGGAAVAATDNSGTWTATFTVLAGAIEGVNRNVSVSATDNVGNITTTADTSNATVDNIAPVVSSVGVPANATYIAGLNLDFTVNTDQAVTVNTSGGTPRLALTIGSSTVYAAYISGSGGSALTFRYTVQAGDLDTNGISVNTLETNSGTLQDASGNNLTLTLNSVGSTAAVLVDAVAPTVSSVDVPANATYVAGNSLSFTVNTSENVTVNTTGGTPRLALTIGATARYATYASGTGTSALVFSYTVQTGDDDADGIAITALETNSGTLKDAAGNDLTLILNSVGDTTAVLVDTTAPTLQSLSPTDEATGVLPSANLVITLNEDLALGTGNIVIYDSNDTPAVVIDVTAHAGQLGISGGDLTINPSTDLVEATSYYVQIASGAITDIPGNPYAGITDNTSWNFAVADITPPVVAVITPDGTPVAGDTSVDFLVVFDETASAITADDFTLTSTGTAAGTVASVSVASGSSVTVTVNSITGTGTLRLDVLANTDIVDGSNNGNNTNGYVAAFTAGDAHTVDRDVPAAPSAPDLATGSDSGEFSTDDITNDTTPTLTGTAEANATVTVSSSVDGILGTATADVSGNWSFTPGSALTTGTHFVSATATDAAGNISASSASLTVQIDATAPVGHSVGFGADFYNAGNIASGSFTFAGAEVGADYSYSISSSGGGTPVTGSGTFATATDPVTGLSLSGLGDGTLTLSVTVTDTAGNAATAVTANAVKDIVLPTGHSVSFNDTTLNAAEAGSTGFTFAGAEVGATYSYSITSSGGGAAVTGNGTFATATDAVTGVNLSGLSDGTLTLSVVVTDTSGNAASAVTANANLDQAIPSVTLSSAAGSLVNSAFSATVTFSEAVSNFVVGDITAGNASLSGFTDNGGGSFSVTVTPTADGTVTMDVAVSVAQDAAGNNNTAATQLSRTYDGTAPSLSSSSPADGSTNAAYSADLTLTFSEPVVAGSGNFTLFDAADDSVVEAFAVGSVTISSNVLTLDPASDLIPTHSYYLQIANTALVDAAGNGYAGISDKTTLNFTVANAAPVANADTGTVAEDTSVSLSVLTNDTDADSAFNLASVTVATPPVNGSTSVNTGTGVITYTPTANYHGSDSFTYTVEDVYSGLSNVATVSITVTQVNDAPVAVADIASTPEDNAVSINVAANDTDIDTGDGVVPASIVILSAPASGSAVVANGEVLYTPNTNFNGSDGFTYTINDQNSATSNVASVVINVTGVNDLPTAGADTATVDEDGTVDIDVLINDSDVDGSIDATSVSILAAASNGGTSVDALTGVITYTPTAHFNGTDSFSYTVQDNSGGSATATVTVTVTSINDAPVANADTATLQEDVAHTINVLGNDTDLDGTLVLASVQVVTAAGQGTTSVNATTGAIIYTPGQNFNGSDSFTYRVQDNEGAWSTPATVTITVQDVNDEPLANNDMGTTSEDAAVTLDLLANDDDVDGTLDPATLVLLTQPANGNLMDNGDGTVLYTPMANFFGSDSFTYSVADDDGGVSNTATVNLTVNPVNDAPVIGGTPAVTVAEDSAYSFTPTASDVDPNATLTFSIINLPVWASFNASTGALTGTPTNDHVGNHSGIVISVSDGSLTAALPAFAISVSNVNDPPVISGTPPPSINQDGSYNFTPTVVDVDAGTTLTYSISNQPPWASFDPATGAFTGTPANSDVGSYNNIVISVSDGIATTPLASFNVTVANVNDAPVITADSYSLNEGGVLNPNTTNGVLANDVDIDGDTLTATLVTAPRNASQFTLNGDGSFNYLHSGDETRIDSFTYRISDGTVSSDPVTVSLSITAVNDAPTFVTSPILATLEGTTYGYDVGVTDPDSVISLTLIDGPSWLTLTGNRLTGTAPLNEIGAVAVVLRAADGQYTVDQSYNVTVTEQEASLVSISTSWLGLPSIVDNTVDLIVTLTHNKGPALSGASLAVTLRDVDTVSTMAKCTAGTNAYTCPVNLATGASTSFRLRLTPEEEGNLIVNLNLTQATEQVAATITDISVTERAVSQGDVTFNIANATALASINLLNDGTRELVAGTALGDTVKLLNYTISSGTAQVIGEIENRGYTDRVRVADIDQDGLEDIVVVNRSGETSAVYYDRGDSFATESGSVTLPHAREALVRDLNDDGFPELILGAGGFNLYIYENNQGVYDIAPLVFNSPASIVHFALLRRLPADAPLDGTLVITSSTAVQLVRFGLNPDGGAAKPDGGQGLGGDGIIEKFSLLRELPLAGVSSIQLVDIDGDGREEIVASTTHQDNNSEASGLTVIAVSPDDQLQEVARLGAASAKHVEVADFNGDGLPDLLVANDNNSYQFYRGTGNSANWTLTNTILYHSSTLVIPEDVNGDGLADVLVYEDGEEQVELYLSAPDGDTGETTDLVISASVTPLQPNSYRFEYTLNLANQGVFVAENVRVNLPLPEGVSVVTLPDNCSHDEEVDEVNCTLPNLEAAAEHAIALILEGDSRIDNLSLTAHATSDALEVEITNNNSTTSLSGMFQNTRARIKGGGGSFDYLVLLGLLGLELRRRRKSPFAKVSPASIRGTCPTSASGGKKRWHKVAALLLPMSAVVVFSHSTQHAQAETPTQNSYLEGSFGFVSSDWKAVHFYSDLAGSTQQGALRQKDDQRSGWQLLYGFRAHRNLALEVGYLDTGRTELEVDAVVSDTAPLRQLLIDNVPAAGEGPYLGLRASVYADHGHELYLKAGLWSWSADYTLTLDNQYEEVKKDSTDWLFGLGFAVPVNDRFQFGGTVQSATLGNDRLMMIGLNVLFQFDVGKGQ